MKVVIIAGGAFPGCMRKTYSDGSWEFWGINAIRPKWFEEAGLRWARWFNIHKWAHLMRDWRGGLEAEVKWAQENPEIPFYTPGDWQGLPNEVVFPRDEINAAFPRPDYHSGSFDWMVAYALLLGAEEVALHGVNLHHITGEPESARACLEYWCGFAEGRGMRIFAGRDCDLFWEYHIVRTKSVYGYTDVHMMEERPDFEFYQGEARRRGWTMPAVNLGGDPHRELAWASYWATLEQHEMLVAAGQQDLTIPPAPAV